jgi:prepilin-type N-terminal cleavage/methylation domain-containing protein
LQGFTLIELSIVLVIIGLIVGGVLVGQDLIRAAEVRAQITQIEKFNTAVNTFHGKFGALPGDMDALTAANFGFTARGLYAGEGDGNGIIEGVQGNSAGQNHGYDECAGETAMSDLGQRPEPQLDSGLIQQCHSQQFHLQLDHTQGLPGCDDRTGELCLRL